MTINVGDKVVWKWDAADSTDAFAVLAVTDDNEYAWIRRDDRTHIPLSVKSDQLKPYKEVKQPIRVGDIVQTVGGGTFQYKVLLIHEGKDIAFLTDIVHGGYFYGIPRNLERVDA